MTESSEQRLFCKTIGQFITWVFDHPGWELTFGEAWRSPQEAARNAATGAGIKNTLHTERLAVDFNFWVNGVLQTATETYKPLGDYWKTLNSLCCWGGDFSKPDGDHFSMTFGGVK